MVDTMCLRVRIHQVYTLDTYNSKNYIKLHSRIERGNAILSSLIGSLHVFIRSYSCSRSLSSSLSPWDLSFHVIRLLR